MLRARRARSPSRRSRGRAPSRRGRAPSPAPSRAVRAPRPGLHAEPRRQRVDLQRARVAAASTCPARSTASTWQRVRAAAQRRAAGRTSSPVVWPASSPSIVDVERLRRPTGPARRPSAALAARAACRRSRWARTGARAGGRTPRRTACARRPGPGPSPPRSRPRGRRSAPARVGHRAERVVREQRVRPERLPAASGSAPCACPAVASHARRRRCCPRRWPRCPAGRAAPPTSSRCGAPEHALASTGLEHRRRPRSHDRRARRRRRRSTRAARPTAAPPSSAHGGSNASRGTAGRTCARRRRRPGGRRPRRTSRRTRWSRPASRRCRRRAWRPAGTRDSAVPISRRAYTCVRPSAPALAPDRERVALGGRPPPAAALARPCGRVDVQRRGERRPRRGLQAGGAHVAALLPRPRRRRR